jgi:ABC-2 type transport system permease protein
VHDVEATWRIEHLLVRPVGRVRWLGTRVLTAAVAVVVIALGVGTGLFGLVPRLTAPLTYGLVVGSYLLDFVGGFLELPEWVLDLSPFRHLAAVPAAGMDVGPALVMLAVGLLAAAAGVLAFRRRDLQEA